MNPHRRALVESVGAAVCGYVIAAVLEVALIRTVRPTEWELAWVSDAALAISLGFAVGSPYVTCLVGTFDLRARTLTYSNAGHPPGIIAGREGIRHLNRGGPPAGLLAEAKFDQELLQLHVGDACLVVTDGVTGALGWDLPLERDLEASWRRCGAESAAELCEAVMARALSGHGPLGVRDWDDDRTVVVVKVSESAML